MNQAANLKIQGAHVALEPKALANGRVCLSSAIGYGFVGPLDIPTEAFHPELQPVARFVREARENGCKDFADVLTYLIQSTEPGEKQALLRSKIADVAEEVLQIPESLERSAAIVREYDLEKRRQQLLWRMNSANEQGEPIGGILKQMVEIEDEGIHSPHSTIGAFPITRAGEMSGIAEAADFVEGLLTEGGASVVYGPSNTGKSFWVLDLAAAVATGSDFRDELEVEHGAVVYLALEGSHGARNRIAALKQAGKLPEAAPFYLCFAPVSLLETGHAARMAETVKQAAKQSAMPCRLVIIDTLARGMAGGDENSGQDMTRAVQAVDVIRAATGAHVLIVHHCGKDEARGARGHSSLRAAVDTEIEVSRPEGETISTVRVTKQRDMPPGEPLPFSLNVITLGTDRRGKPITSCVVHHESSVMAANRSKLGRKPEVKPESLLEFLPLPTTAAWRKAADEADGTTKSSFYRSLTILKTRGAVVQGADGSWNLSEPLQHQGFPRVPE